MTDVAKETVKAPFGQTTHTTQSVQFKGRPGALELQLDPDAPLLTILSELRQLLEQNQQLLGQTTLSLNFGDRPVDMLQYNELRRVIERFGHKIKQVMLTPESVESYLEGELGISVQLQLPSLVLEAKVPVDEPVSEPPPVLSAPMTTPQAPPAPSRQTSPYEGHASRVAAQPIAQEASLPFPSLTGQAPAAPTMPEPTRQPTRRPQGPLPEFETQPEGTNQRTRPGIVTVEPTQPQHRPLHKVLRTCRAGTFIDVEGDVVVFGDLNPGAEIRATGDIIVFGALRGMAHAGAKGNDNAIIAAFELSPTQLRLANQIAIAPADEDGRPRTKLPIEIAYLNPNRQIEVEACQNGKFPPAIRELSL